MRECKNERKGILKYGTSRKRRVRGFIHERSWSRVVKRGVGDPSSIFDVAVKNYSRDDRRPVKRRTLRDLSGQVV